MAAEAILSIFGLLCIPHAPSPDHSNRMPAYFSDVHTEKNIVHINHYTYMTATVPANLLCLRGLSSLGSSTKV